MIEELIMKLKSLVTPSSVTVLIAGLTFFANTCLAWKSYRADLISKARIKWLNEARNLSTQLIHAYYRSSMEVNGLYYFTDEDEDEARIDSAMNSLDANYDKFMEYRTLFMMYFGPNAENDKILQILDTIKSTLDNYKLTYYLYREGEYSAEEAEKITKEYAKEGQSNLELFSNKCRAYFKKEWVKVKKGR